jgi:hypothetical protein
VIRLRDELAAESIFCCDFSATSQSSINGGKTQGGSDFSGICLWPGWKQASVSSALHVSFAHITPISSDGKVFIEGNGIWLQTPYSSPISQIEMSTLSLSGSNDRRSSDEPSHRLPLEARGSHPRRGGAARWQAWTPCQSASPCAALA